MHNEEFFNHVKDYLLSQSLKVGDVIATEHELARHFGVTRHKIRGVLDTLARMGVLERTPRRGTTIKSFDADTLSSHIKFRFDVANFNLAEFKEARAIIECAVLPLAVKRITQSQIAELAQTIENLEQNAHMPDVADNFDLAFHMQILQAAGNKVLNAFSGVLTLLFMQGDYRNKFRSEDYLLNRVAKEHRLMLTAIQHGEHGEAVRLMKEHLLVHEMGIKW